MKTAFWLLSFGLASPLFGRTATLGLLLLASALLPGQVLFPPGGLTPGSGYVNTLRSGRDGPANLLGNHGNFYVDTSAHALSGPKAAGASTVSAVSLTGPPGAQNGSFDALGAAAALLSASETFSGNNTHTGTNTFTQNVSASKVNLVTHIDGVTYPYTAAGVQSAMNAVGAGGVGGTVLLPDTFTLGGNQIDLGTTTLTIPAGVTLACETRAACWLRYTGSSAAISFPPGTNNAGLRNVTIWLNAPASGQTCISITGNIATSHVSQENHLSGNTCYFASLVNGTVGMSAVGTAAPADVALNWFEDNIVKNAASPYVTNHSEQNWWINNFAEGFNPPAVSIGSDSVAQYGTFRVAGSGVSGNAISVAGSKNHLFGWFDSGAANAYSDTGAYNQLDGIGFSVTNQGSYSGGSSGTYNGAVQLANLTVNADRTPGAVINTNVANANADLLLDLSGVAKAQIGTPGVAGNIITGSALNDLALTTRAAGGCVDFSADSGASIGAQLCSAGGTNLWTAGVLATGPATWAHGSSNPAGSCANGSLYSQTTSGALYVCQANAWAGVPLSTNNTRNAMQTPAVIASGDANILQNCANTPAQCSNWTFTNDGATSGRVVTLDHNMVPGASITLYVAAAQAFSAYADTGCKIRYGTSLSSASGGIINTGTLGANVTLRYLGMVAADGVNEWVVVSAPVGTWTTF